MYAIVPFLNEAAFDQRDIAEMSVALDDICNRLVLREDSLAREVIAYRIVELSQCSEGNATSLRDTVLRELGFVNRDRRHFQRSGLRRQSYRPASTSWG